MDVECVTHFSQITNETVTPLNENVKVKILILEFVEIWENSDMQPEKSISTNQC